METTSAFSDVLDERLREDCNGSESNGAESTAAEAKALGKKVVKWVAVRVFIGDRSFVVRCMVYHGRKQQKRRKSKHVLLNCAQLTFKMTAHRSSTTT